MDIRKNVNEFQAKPFGRGQAFKCMNKHGRVYTYLISYGRHGRVFLANLETGKSWDKDVAAVAPTSLSPAEATALFDGLEIIAALEVSTKEIEVTKPGRPFKVGQLLRCQHPGKESETIVQIAYSDVPGSVVRLVTVTGPYPGRLCGDPVAVQDATEITQAEFDQMNRNLEIIEEVKPTFEAA